MEILPSIWIDLFAICVVTSVVSREGTCSEPNFRPKPLPARRRRSCAAPRTALTFFRKVSLSELCRNWRTRRPAFDHFLDSVRDYVCDIVILASTGGGRFRARYTFTDARMNYRLYRSAMSIFNILVLSAVSMQSICQCLNL